MSPFNPEKFFHTTDQMNPEAFASLFTPDATMVMANNPPANGTDALAGLAAGMYSMVEALRHQIHRSLIHASTCWVDGTVTYTLRNQQELSLPFASIFDFDQDGLVTHYKAFVDIQPLLESIEAQSQGATR